MQRAKADRLFYILCRAVTWVAVSTLLVLLVHILIQGASWLSVHFLTNFPSRHPHEAGVRAGLYGSVLIMLISAAFAVPVGIATALFLEEYMPKNRWWFFLQVNISNLAGMPSIIYGLLGLAIFVRFLGFERSVLSGGLTLGLLTLPVIIIASQEAIRAVPRTLREAAYALGAMRWQVIFGQVLPSAMPGIMTGIILAVSRAMGETAPLIIVGAVSYISFTPTSLMDSFTVLPMQVFSWAGRPQEDFHSLAGAAIIVLLVLLFAMNLVAVYIRQRFQRYKI